MQIPQNPLVQVYLKLIVSFLFLLSSSLEKVVVLHLNIFLSFTQCCFVTIVLESGPVVFEKIFEKCEKFANMQTDDG